MSAPSTSRSPPGHGRPDLMARQSSSSSTLNRRFFSSSNPPEDARWARGDASASPPDMMRGPSSSSSSGAERARSTSHQQAGLLQRPPMPPPSGSATSQYGAYHAGISTSDIDFSDVAAMGSGGGLGDSASPQESRTTPYLGSGFPDPGIDLSWDGTITPTGAGDVDSSLGGLQGALADAASGSGRRKEEISPWLFQGADSPALGSATPSSYRGDSRGGMGSRSLSGSQSTFSLRPTTPPSGYSANGSSGNISIGSTPGGSKRSRNPLKFLKKKSSQAIGRDPDATPSPPHHRWASSNEMPPAVPPLPGRVGPHPGTASVLAARGRSNSYVQSVQGIEDELEHTERSSAFATASPREGSIRETKRRVLRRPRTRDKEREKSRGEDDWASILEGKPLPGSGGGAGAGLDGNQVEISLDTNFDHIEDIIDVTKRKTSGPIGPMNEELSPREELISQDPQHLVGLHRESSRDGPGDLPGRPRSTSATMQRPHPRSSDSSSAASSSEREKDRYATISGGRAPTLRRLGSGPSPTTVVSAGSSSPAKRGPPQVNLNKPGLRRITLAEAQQHLASRSAKSSSSSSPGVEALPSSAASLASTWEPPRHRPSADVPPGTEGDSLAREARKDSAISNNSQRSGVSPKSSTANLAAGYRVGRGPEAGDASMAGNWTRSGGVADPSYRFPPPRDAPMPDPGGVRRSSASSASKAASSTWMAPDSWAVQPDRMRDYLRDEEESDLDDDADAQSTTTTGIAVSTERENSSATGSGSALTGSIASILRSGSRDGSGGNSHHIASIFGSRRGTQDSNASGVSSGSYSEASPQHLRHLPMDGGDFEILEGAEGMDSHRSLPGTPLTSPPHTSSGPLRPSSRGGAALAAAGGAAAAAAGKLGLRSKHRGGSRPNTAGSLGAGGGRSGVHSSHHQSSASTHIVNGVSNGMVDDDTGRSIRSSAGVLKRPSTISSQATGKPYTMRIYKNDGSLLTVAVPLYATTAELRSALARKGTLAWSGAFRLFVRDKGAERPLGESEKPAMLQRRRMEQAGYTEDDGLEELGSEDLSYLLKFVYRTDSVTEFDSEAFGNTEDRLRLLDLQNHNLEMVPIFLYRHANWIVSLDLSGNPMSDLPSDFIQSAVSLRTLRLSRLALKRVPQSVRLSESLTHLELSDNRIPELSHIALDEMPQLTSIKVQNNRLSDLPSYFARMSALKYLNVSNNRFEVFPAVLCELRGLIELDISFNALTKLPDPELGQLEKLERLVLVGNSIDVLPPVVTKLVSLQAIDLRRNLLQDVSMLFSLPRLQDLQCEHNAIKAIDASFGPRLRSLDAGHNPLSRVRFGAAAESSLTSLNLTSANLAKLDEGVFAAFNSLTTLILDRNHFVVLPDSLAELTQLQYLSCNNNRLATLPEGIGRLSSLRRLHVHNNNLKTLPSSIWHCGALLSINVSSNLLESFPSPSLAGAEDAGRLSGSAAAASILMGGGISEQGRKGSAASLGPPPLTPTGTRVALPMATSLKKLRLGDNRLTDDVFTVLGSLGELEILNLSFNEIYEIPNFGLTKFPRLVELYLSGNNLSSVPADDIPHLSQLRILHLNANKLQTLPAEIKELKKLHNLDVGNNTLKYNISNQQYDWNWNSSPALRYLNLSGNKRFEIKSSATGGGQMGARKPDIASDFQRLHNLRVLGLMDVTMTLRTLPDPHEDRRVRTSLSHINSMAYGISDALGKLDHLSIVDVVMPEFRKDPNQCLFGLFEGRDHGRNVGSRIASHLAEWVKFRVEWEMQRLQKMGQYNPSEPGCIPKVMRRAFLRMEKEYADMLMAEGSRKISNARLAAQKDGRADAPAIAEATNFSQWRSGASAVIAYIHDKTLYIANAGDALAVLSRNGGTAYLVSTKHEPFDRDETLRIRSAEGWVSLRGYVNDRLDVSRSFGYYHLSPIVNAAPAVATVQLTDSDEFVILANRVLWNYMSYQTAVDIARQERDDLMVAAQKLRDFAISYGAEDSIMVMIVAVGDLFNAGRQPRDGYFDPAVEAVRQRANRGRAREDLPGDRTLARLEREVAPPIGQVALVFTDIKNSTSLWETNGGMQSAMRLHNYLLRRQLRTIGGYEVKTEGDAFMCSFPSVTSALLWCFSVQLQLLREDWPQELLDSEDGKEVRDASGETIYRGLSVRMGIHWGYPVCEADPITRRMDYFGPMVNRASRISGAADGGQILVSRDVISELTALLGTFGERDDEADGDANGSGRRRGELGDEEQEDEDTFRLLNPNVSRDIVLLRRMGFGISEMGERKLKGLETPEFLNLVYPKQLAGRLEVKADAPAPQVFEPTIQLLDIDQIKHLGVLCLRLEALSDGAPLPAIQEHASQALQATTPGVATDAEQPFEKRDSRAQQQHTSLQLIPARRKEVEKFLADRPELLIYSIRDDATDEELVGILGQLVSRISNALSTLQLRQLISKASAGSGGASPLGQIDIAAMQSLLAGMQPPS